MASPIVLHAKSMRGKEKKIHWEQIKSPLQKVFVRRLSEEMKKRDLTDNQLSSLCETIGKPVGQSSISRITGGRQDPSLENVDAISTALGWPAWYLFTDAASARREVVQPPPAPPRMPGYPQTFVQQSEVPYKSESARRKTSRSKIK